jgi:hypothetical protein
MSFSHIFRNTSLSKNVPLFARDLKLLTILFLRCLLVNLPFAKPMPIFSVRGTKRPCYPSEKLRYFYEGGGDRKDLNNKRFTALVPTQISLQLLPLNC